MGYFLLKLLVPTEKLFLILPIYMIASGAMNLMILSMAHALRISRESIGGLLTLTMSSLIFF